MIDIVVRHIEVMQTLVDVTRRPVAAAHATTDTMLRNERLDGQAVPSLLSEFPKSQGWDKVTLEGRAFEFEPLFVLRLERAVTTEFEGQCSNGVHGLILAAVDKREAQGGHGRLNPILAFLVGAKLFDNSHGLNQGRIEMNFVVVSPFEGADSRTIRQSVPFLLGFPGREAATDAPEVNVTLVAHVDVQRAEHRHEPAYASCSEQGADVTAILEHGLNVLPHLLAEPTLEATVPHGQDRLRFLDAGNANELDTLPLVGAFHVTANFPLIHGAPTRAAVLPASLRPA